MKDGEIDAKSYQAARSYCPDGPDPVIHSSGFWGFYPWVDFELGYWGVFVHSWMIDCITMFYFSIGFSILGSLLAGVAVVPPWRRGVRIVARRTWRRCRRFGGEKLDAWRLRRAPPRPPGVEMT